MTLAGDHSFNQARECGRVARMKFLAARKNMACWSRSSAGFRHGRGVRGKPWDLINL